MQRSRPNTANLHVDGIPQFPLHLLSGVYLALLSASSWTNVSSLNPLPQSRCILSCCHGFERDPASTADANASY